MSKEKKNDLSKFFKTVEWKESDKKHSRIGAFNHSMLCVGVGQYKMGSEKKYFYVSVRIGQEIIDKIGWKAGDQIIPMINPDDHLIFMLVKSDNGRGYKLNYWPNTKIMGFKFRYFGDVILEDITSKNVDFAVNGKSIIFELR